MDEMMKNKMDDMELDKASGGKISPWHPKAPRPRPGCHDVNPINIKDVKLIKNVNDIKELGK